MNGDGRGRRRSAAFSALGFAAMGVFAVLLVGLPAQGVFARAPSPMLLALVVQAWRSPRPEAAPQPLVCALGLFHDIALGWTLGAGAIPLILAAAQQRGRRAGVFPGRWLDATLFVAMVLFGAWLLESAAHAALSPIRPLLGHLVATILAYPVVEFALRRVFGVGDAQSGAKAWR